MSNESSIIDNLRSVRHTDDLLTRLQEGTLESVRPKLEEALADPDWAHGPAELKGIYGNVRKVLATNKRGETIRISVKEGKDNTLVLGKVEVFNVAMPTMDIAQEMLETAKAASIAILEDDFDSAAPMLKAMSRSLDVHGDLHRRVTIEMDIQGLQKNRWYHEVVADNFTGEIEIPALVQEGELTNENLAEALDALADFFVKETGLALGSLKKATVLSNTKIVEDAASAITEDMKHAVRALKGVSRDSQEEMIRVYESVLSVAPRLVAGARFLVKLVDDELSENEE
jgi:hypothetical protein